ncbi:hypothetical protein J6590_026112 [Homalodisca vitripennis]|nr:hypothetical protein J6590_026112 [Homalodisca vitripennis]
MERYLSGRYESVSPGETRATEILPVHNGTCVPLSLYTTSTHSLHRDIGPVNPAWPTYMESHSVEWASFHYTHIQKRRLSQSTEK